MSDRRARERKTRGRALLEVLGSASVAVCALVAGPISADDRAGELETLRERIAGSRERVTAHEADERALLERLEDVDRRLNTLVNERASAEEEAAAARAVLDEVEPRLAKAERSLEQTRKALTARAVALYRGGEIGPLRVLFSADSLAEILQRAAVLRRLVRHDASLLARFERERESLDAVRLEASRAAEAQATAQARFETLKRELQGERKSKGQLLARVRDDRKAERRLLLELEQAAQALEETIRTLGNASRRRAASADFASRKGSLAPPVEAKLTQRFGRVVDPEHQTTTVRNGVDFGAAAGTPVVAVAPGIARFAGWFRGYGRIVIVDHGDAFHTVSGHLDEIFVEVGQKLVEGEPIGTVGETGSLRGPSLYFELRSQGEPIDPANWFE